ncbi:hypothetical protein GCM10008107_07190 [Psychrosphaera saromensis]|uniref:Uncharacterized protein n=1 Tax=Psychrosphaera saromensis TaxID=716813 RepID=A0A2S7UWP9_9GAMM|nr:DUF4144 domain-containing protein [Psychrosphaera saromensis]PQJ54373.1 hypothetical protein BTO11_12375 [Psychrosphaera saromensis]GHB60504.1 hypothetical protein GCM10008107_07190 [Psychrosphaera saromensis]GLQ14583.1 hypothetical protein GCM10007917_20380 [Psychrosphaera saromensis]
MISWPCMLKLDGDDELIYLDSLQNLNSECSELIFSDDDYVIDSLGHCYLIEVISGKLELTKEDRALSTDEATDLIRAHEFNKASVCLTKIYFLTVSEAIGSLAS